MDIPRGHAAMPITDADFLDFIYNYYKAEYAPIRSFWSTATAFPHAPSRWINMGHELQPLSVRPANAQAQKDLESLDYFTRKWNLDADFVRGIVIRFAKYEVHERLEKKLYECARLDLMVRKSLKEKHLIDALWPSPAPRNLAKELLAQGVQVRQWYGDMFNKYFRVLHSLESFELRPEVDQRIKSSSTLMLIPFIDHLVFGTVDPILPIVASGMGYANAKNRDRRERSTPGFGEPGKFEIRFDAPVEVTDTYTQSVVRQCQCMKCGTKRDVQVVVSVDPNPNAGAAGGGSSRAGGSTAASRRKTSKTTQKYSPGYDMPGEHDAPPPQPPRPQAPEESARPSSPEMKKQCPRCTFLNFPALQVCEMCQADLPETTIPKPPSPKVVKKTSHSHSASTPNAAPNAREEALRASERPSNRHSLSSSLFSIFPFSQQNQQEHHAKLPPTQQIDTSPVSHSNLQREVRREGRPSPQVPATAPTHHPPPHPEPATARTSTPPNPATLEPGTPLSRAPEMAMMPLTPPSTGSALKRPAPAGLPSNLMDDFVPVSPAYQRDAEDEDAGWGEVSKKEAKEDESSDEAEGKNSGGLIDLDAVARDEADVWGDRDD
ncbi:hypothetical protein T440DRAFT_468478 [Plenodomus tracheiphilus IPT5]|uniref:RanBP2-type domain-containing protein n=1 Tax=Plenodomus tracheiphilus IPT5 TaxID=1408161 RepID=A0A6A7B5H5_9PLEO|nr:hypothetical protein T440DRAFT_468478 [Plenodomus tracheiphilus IPT5]